jgi:hypothetical protein
MALGTIHKKIWIYSYRDISPNSKIGFASSYPTKVAMSPVSSICNTLNLCLDFKLQVTLRSPGTEISPKQTNLEAERYRIT